MGDHEATGRGWRPGGEAGVGNPPNGGPPPAEDLKFLGAGRGKKPGGGKTQPGKGEGKVGLGPETFPGGFDEKRGRCAPAGGGKGRRR